MVKNHTFYYFRKSNSTLSSKEKKRFYEKEAFKKLILLDLSQDEKKNIIESEEFKKMINFKPLIMRDETLAKYKFKKGIIDDDGKMKASKDHNSLINIFTESNNSECDIDLVIEALTSLVYTIRCNLKHHGKTQYGPVLDETNRDKNICSLVNGILALLLNILLEHPEEKIAVYGTLKKNEVNHEILEKHNLEFVKGHVIGYLKYDDMNLPYFIWDISKDNIEVEVYYTLTTIEFEELDGLESNYKKRLIPVDVGNKLVVSYIYSDK